MLVEALGDISFKTDTLYIRIVHYSTQVLQYHFLTSSLIRLLFLETHLIKMCYGLGCHVRDVIVPFSQPVLTNMIADSRYESWLDNVAVVREAGGSSGESRTDFTANKTSQDEVTN